MATTVYEREIGDTEKESEALFNCPIRNWVIVL